MSRAQATPKNSEEPYVGQYSLDQGGTDAAGAVHLLLFSGGNYAIVYFGGMQQGTWKPLANGELELQEWVGDRTDFALYGRRTPDLRNEVLLTFHGFEESYAKVGFLESGDGVAPLHPAFNDDANCYASKYSIRRPAGELAALQLATFGKPPRDEFRPAKPVQKVLYSFPLNGRYNDYHVVHRPEASQPAASYIGRYVNNELTLYSAALARVHGIPGDRYGERSLISANDVKEIQPYIKKARQPLPEQLVIRTENADDVGGQTTYQRVAGTTQSLQQSDIKLIEPLFTARCE